MAITIDNSPQQFTPVYNDLFWMFSSTNSGNDGFRYIVWLYINGTVVKKDKIVPLPTSGDGKYNASKSLSANVSWHELFPVNSVTGSQDGEDLSYVVAQVKIGEEYFGNTWDFTGYGYAGTSTGWSNQTDPSVNPGGFARTFLRQSVDAPPYSAGDTIIVTLNDPNTNSFIGGIQKVLDTYTDGGQEYLVLELPWQTLQTPSTFEGTTTYADGRKTTVDPDSGSGVSSATTIVFNGAEPFETFKDWDYTDWHCDNPNAKFLTTLPRGQMWKVREDSAIFLQYYNDIREDPVYIQWEKFISPIISNIPTYELVTSSVDGVVMVDVSPVKAGILSTISYLNVGLTDANFGTPGRLSETLQFEIDDRCYDWEDVEIAFMDRMGSILPFQFNLRHTKRMKSTKETYKKDIDSTTMYSYELIDGGKTALNIEEDIRYTLRTEYLNFEEANYLRELVTSPFTVVRFGTGDYMRCNVITSDLTIREQIDGNPNYYEIEIELSNKDKVNW